MALVESFDSYTDGALNGQGTWADFDSFAVQGTTVQSGAKAVSTATGGNKATKAFTGVTAGSQVVWGRTTDVTTTDVWDFKMVEAAVANITWCRTNGGNMEYRDGSAVWHTVGTVSANTWFQLTIQWDIATQKARYQVDSQGFTAYDTMNSNITVNVNTVSLDPPALAGPTIYYDSFSDVSASVATTPVSTLPLLGVG